jgi:hypothetical protein
MTNQHPIMPPDELVQQWRNSKILLKDALMVAAQWGADQQLAEDAKWLDHNALNEPHLRITPVGELLKEAMRPKPQTLNSIALEMLGTIEKMDVVIPEITDTIRRALEALPND